MLEKIGKKEKNRLKATKVLFLNWDFIKIHLRFGIRLEVNRIWHQGVFTKLEQSHAGLSWFGFELFSKLRLVLRQK